MVASKHPGQELPVSAGPTVLTCSDGLITRGKFVKQLNVRGQGDPGKNTFEKIVAQEGVLGHFPRQRRFKGIDVVNAFAGVRAFLEQILVNIRNSRRIGIDPTRAGEDPLRERTFRSIGSEGVIRGCTIA